MLWSDKERLLRGYQMVQKMYRAKSLILQPIQQHRCELRVDLELH